MPANSDKRIISDRRRFPTPILCRHTFIGGRRKTARRNDDKKIYIFMDRFSSKLLVFLLLLLLLNCIDAFLTLSMIYEGSADEANPAMSFLLKHGALTFIISKFFITSFAVVFFCLFKNVKAARIGMLFLIFMYILLIMYEFNMVLSVRH